MKMKVLIIDDCECTQKRVKECLEESGIIVISAFTFAEARQLFGDHSDDLDVIAVDGCLESKKGMDTEPLVKEIRPKFSGIMIAISSSEEFRDMLVKAGCDEACEKFDLANRILAINENSKSPESSIYST